MFSWNDKTMAACSTYAGEATFNEYYFGSDPNFLEMYIKNVNNVPQTAWQNWVIRVYESTTVFTDYVLNDMTSTYCPFGNKAYVTFDVPGGLPSPDVSVVLFDDSGNEVDYLDACGPPGSCSLPGYYTPDPGVCSSTDHDIFLDSLGNKDIARFPDGTGTWAISGGTGSGTSYTSCTTNNAGVAKASNVSAVTIGSNFTFTIDALNNSKSADTFVIEDNIPAGFTYVSSVPSQGTVDVSALPLLVWNVGTLAKNGGTASLTMTVTGSVLGTHENTAVVTSPCTEPDPADCPRDTASVLVEPPSIDHYAVSYPNGNPGITCEALAVQIEAHNNVDVAVVPSAGTTITLSSAPIADGWSLKSGNGTFTAPNQYEFDGVETFAQFWLTETTATVAPHIDIDVTDGSFTDNDGDVTEDINAIFDDAIFRFFAAGAPEVIGTQIAGKASNIAPGNQALQLRAVQTSTTTAQCEAALVGTTAVDIAYECNNPTTCTAANLLTMSTAADTQTIARNNNASVVSYTPLNMVFDASGIASFDTSFSDAGEITLHATKTLPVGSGTPPSTADTLIGASNAFVVRPFGMDIDFSSDRATNGITGPSYAADANGSIFQVAGAVFPASLSAVMWDSVDDTDNNGIADACADLTNNTVTANFGNESVAVVPADVVLVNTLFEPAAGVAGNLVVSSNAASFASGVGTKSIYWDEVGITHLDSTLTNYLGSGQDVLGNVCNVGRFYPNNFALANPVVTNRSDIVACGDPFTYMSENFEINYDISAYSLNPPGTVTQNYIGNFARLDPTMLAEMNYGATDSGTNLTARLSVGSAGVFAAGVASVQATLALMRNATADGLYANFEVGIAPADSDTVALLPAALDLSLNGGPNTHGLLGQTDIRYGRLITQNNFGSELLSLAIPMTTEYYLDATAEFVTNVDDSCTTRAIADVLLYNDQEPKAGRAVGNPVITVNGAATTTLTAVAPFVNGVSSLSFAAPNAEGYIDVEIQTPSYLLSDIDGIDQGVLGPGAHCTPGLAVSDPAYIAGCVLDGNVVDEIPLSRGNFGIFRGSDNVIYTREVYQADLLQPHTTITKVSEVLLQIEYKLSNCTWM